MCAALAVSSCNTATGAGAYAGSSLGSILGSAIGGIAGGPRGSDIGTIVGMAGGAAIGGAIGNAAEKQQHDALAQRNQRIQRSKTQQNNDRQPYGNYSGSYGNGSYNGRSYNNYGNDNTQPYTQPNADLDPSAMVDSNNSGDDRIDMEPASPTSQSERTPNQNGTALATDKNGRHEIEASRIEQIAKGNRQTSGKLTIKNVRFADANGDRSLSAGETGQITFEIYNNTESPIYDFDPTVTEANANNRIYISPSVRVENIYPGQGLRYTATVKADKRIKNGEAQFMVSANKDGRPISYITVVKVPTIR